MRVRGNRFVRPQAAPTRRGADHFADGGALIWLGRCRDIRFEGNTVIAPGACFGQIFHLDPTATDVRGMNDGVRR